MNEGRYVVIALARPRQPWSAELARWSTSGAAPIEVVTCMSSDEVLAVVGSGRRVSALLADAGAARVDRELIHSLRGAAVPSIIVADGKVQRDWDSLGAAEILGPAFDVAQLLDTLGRAAVLVVDDLRVPARVQLDTPTRDRATLVVVTGAGGAGSSTVAMGIAQSLAHPGSDGTGARVALVDGVRRGDLAMYHDVGDVIPGLPELVDAHRVDTVEPDEVRRLLFHITERSYDVLLGLRRPRDWVSLRPRSVEAALDGLRRAHDAVVLDVDADLEGEDDTGSVDVEDRHCVTRCGMRHADLVVVVGTPGLKGLHDLVRLTDDVALAGVPTTRILPVLNRATRNPASRSSTVLSLTRLAHDSNGPPLVHLPVARRLEHAHRQVGRLPEALCRPLGRAVRQVLLDVGPRATAVADVETPVRPGTLGTPRRVDAAADREIA